jgi:uncharacterized NAD(P)/FAD-binding protein YdhS
MPALSAVQSSCAFASPDPLDQAIQQELAALAAAAATHRSACRWLDEWSGPEGVKEHVAHRIEERHRREREPHLLRLAELHQHRMALTISQRVRGPTPQSKSVRVSDRSLTAEGSWAVA